MARESETKSENSYTNAIHHFPKANKGSIKHYKRSFFFTKHEEPKTTDIFNQNFDLWQWIYLMYSTTSTETHIKLWTLNTFKFKPFIDTHRKSKCLIYPDNQTGVLVLVLVLDLELEGILGNILPKPSISYTCWQTWNCSFKTKQKNQEVYMFGIFFFLKLKINQKPKREKVDDFANVCYWKLKQKKYSTTPRNES